MGVEVSVRLEQVLAAAATLQLRRARPLEVEEIIVQGYRLRVPPEPEILLINAWRPTAPAPR